MTGLRHDCIHRYRRPDDWLSKRVVHLLACIGIGVLALAVGYVLALGPAGFMGMIG